ncbi:MAG: ADOP family duplicated permease [Gemmatimonadaceae bacterium]
MTRPDATPAPALPRLPAALITAFVPYAERDEVLSELAAEYGARAAERGPRAARLWLWRQAFGSLPMLLRRSWWRAWTGFEPDANRMRPGGPMIEGWIIDARYAARRLRSRPTYSILAVLTLALGAGGTAAVYSLVRTLLLEPLPYAREQELAVFWMPNDWTEQEFLYLRGTFPGFRQVAAYRPEDVTLQAENGPSRFVPGLASSAELFSVLGVAPAIGRGFQTGDDVPGAEPVAVLSYGLWQELGGDASIVGRRLLLDGTPRTVIGVMPRGFWFPEPTVRIWTPTPLDARRTSGNYAFIGRVSPGMRVDAMAAPVAQLVKRLDERFDYPEAWDKTKNAALTPVRQYILGSVRPSVLAVLAAMGVILLIACANVAALMLGQVDSRSTELAVRAALGAGRQRLIQQLVLEALLVGLVAGAVGAALAASGFRLLIGALPLGALAETAVLDWTVFWAAITIAVLAALLVAVVPAVAVVRSDLRGTISKSRTGGIGGRGGRLEGGLVVAQVALAVLLAAGAGLLIRSVAKLHAIDPGVDTRGIAVVDIAMPAESSEQERLRMLRELLPPLRTLPGVRSVGAVQRLALHVRGDNWGVRVEGRPDLDGGTSAFRVVTPGYFETMGIAVRRGRGFDVGIDRPTGEVATVINEALAAKYFPDVNPIGRRLVTFGAGERIVGVVENVAEQRLTEGPQPAHYVLYDQVPYTPETHSIVLKVDGERRTAGVLEAARRAIQQTAPTVAIQEMTTMESVFSKAVGPARQVMTLLTLLTALALVLGAVGIYGVISHFVTRRRRDYGVRIALGQSTAGVIRQVVGRGGVLVAIGSAIGIAGALVLARLLASFLYGVGAADPMAMGAAVAALAAVGLAAAYIPARRASRTDPVLVLRTE